MRLRPVILAALALGLVLSAACVRPGTRARAGLGLEPLAAAWRFAGAITEDPKDRAASQERVALAYLERGDSDEALRLAESIEGWRRGVVLAEAATRLAEQGRPEEALARAQQAEDLARGIQDWQRDRILARAAKAKALLGRLEDVDRASAFYRTHREYHGETAAYQALALARQGRAAEGRDVLEGLAGSRDFDTLVWRVKGYQLLGAAGVKDPAEAAAALQQAWSATDSVPGPRRLELQLELAEDAARAGQKAAAAAWLEAVTSNLVTGALSSHLRAPLLARLAVGWGTLMDTGAVAQCAQQAGPLIAELQGIEQPALAAQLAEARVRAGDRARGTADYVQAIEAASALANPRPRALALVEICLSLDRCGRLRDPGLRAALSRALRGLGVADG